MLWKFFRSALRGRRDKKIRKLQRQRAELLRRHSRGIRELKRVEAKLGVLGTMLPKENKRRGP